MVALILAISGDILPVATNEIVPLLLGASAAVLTNSKVLPTEVLPATDKAVAPVERYLGVLVPIPKLLLVSSQKKLALSCVYVPDAPANITEPVVNAVDVPVPPDVTPNVPANVTAPVVAVFGVSPLNDVWNDVTAAVLGIAPHVGADPVLPIKTCPVVPAAVTLIGEVPLPYKTPFEVNVVSPVPPAATGNVPAVKAEADVE